MQGRVFQAFKLGLKSFMDQLAHHFEEDFQGLSPFTTQSSIAFISLFLFWHRLLQRGRNVAWKWDECWAYPLDVSYNCRGADELSTSDASRLLRYCPTWNKCAQPPQCQALLARCRTSLWSWRGLQCSWYGRVRYPPCSQVYTHCRPTTAPT